MTTEELEQIGQVVDERVKKQLKPVNRRLKTIEHSIKLVLKYHDEMHINLRSRVEALEKQASHN